MLLLTVLILCVGAFWASPLEKQLKGVTFRNPQPRISSGEPAEFGQLPWKSAVHLSGNGSSWVCGGSIINEEWILTAGHCVDGAREAIVYTGIVRLQDPDRTVSQSSDIILHRDYNRITLENDIGLVRLARPLEFNENVRAISLDSNTLRVGEDVTVSGWGLTTDHASSVSPIMNSVTLRSISNDECEQYYGSLPDCVVCATFNGNPVQSLCHGDSGSPLFTGAGSSAVQVAVTSFANIKGCESGAPVGFTRAANYLDWISKNTGIPLNIAIKVQFSDTFKILSILILILLKANAL